MIERAAKAIKASLLNIADEGILASHLERTSMDIASGALEAVAEPTQEMIEAGGAVEIDGPAETVLPNIWRAMHRAMLRSDTGKKAKK